MIICMLRIYQNKSKQNYLTAWIIVLIEILIGFSKKSWEFHMFSPQESLSIKIIASDWSISCVMWLTMLAKTKHLPLSYPRSYYYTDCANVIFFEYLNLVTKLNNSTSITWSLQNLLVILIGMAWHWNCRLAEIREKPVQHLNRNHIDIMYIQSN